ncbi:MULTISPECIES: cytochrome c-type biogenesis protein [Vibrio]|uniref:cytochrome c-type biogenesis protein n=1 Tax=Vibrio TaxID=662 RepID=UPI0001B93FC4|nr:MULTISPECIES: cytochrome c-type biogenesis protein [Vibrio]EEX33986.1 cytochrome c-type heme lyase subunit nrfF nitrite reductase complex assembly [Vibrio coralliilyticus ATCC BAA-450]MCM5510866.1 cytochrome c-type biogenesis protein CcmH [Vibrio sp. SCSIO 43169]MDE3900333.1 cytochrome c-type biogenesis protein CcmH [Vibrio sp. CC007]QFT35618.1 Cytochrome c-type biogenesis protein CcmH precursor [Vibrio sp. THAF64]QGM33517.1 Cytochrome c-type biogenesis protein CcmH precursor [Vibrio sp. TH
MRALYYLILLLFVQSSYAGDEELFVAVSEQQISQVELFEFTSPELHEKALRLAKSLRCPQCQNQNLIESNSPIAKDLRLIVFNKINQGESEQEVKDFMTARYGEFVLYQPEFTVRNALLWFAPILLLLMFITLSIRRVRVNSNNIG